MQNQGQMETSSKTSSNVSSGTANAATGPSVSGNTSAAGDSGDVYEFKSSKEPTPVRGSSSSPNPNPEKDKDGTKSTGSQAAQSSGNNVSAAGSATTSSGETTTTSITADDAPAVSASPSSKRSFESDNTEEQDEENRRKKRKESEPVKENIKGNNAGRQSTGRNAGNAGEKVRLPRFIKIFYRMFYSRYTKTYKVGGLDNHSMLFPVEVSKAL